MASTILRVKRRLEDNPQDALVLMCKRMKTDEEEISPSLFVFCATVKSEEATHVKNIVPKTNANIKSVPDVGDIIQKIRKERKENSVENRYEVVNCSRGLKENNNEDDDDIFNLVDLRQKAEALDTDVQYAYDLYTAAAASKDFDISMIDNLVSIENYETDLILGSYRDNGRRTPSSDDADDDDSNDENNWRNDYPDSEKSSIDEDDMIRAMERVDIDDLSSDTGEDKIYDEPPDFFNEDVKRYGEAYAKYKAKVLNEHPDLAKTTPFMYSTTVQDLDEESVDGYKDDSDDGFYYGQDQDTENFKDQYRSNSSDEYSPD